MGYNFIPLFFIPILMHFCSYPLVSTASSCIKQERESLLRLKASFIDSSNRLASWKGIDCCNWDGVGCDRSNNGHVVKLDLRNYEYFYSSGLISNGVDSSLSELKYLNYLDLSGNYFNYTPIPNYLSSMFELKYLNLSHACFRGGIPRSLGNLTQLRVLDFNYKKKIFDRPELFTNDLGWISSLSSLEYLDLSRVRVLQSNLDFVQMLNTLPSLLSLKLKSCDLQNTHNIYAPLNSSFLSKLQYLDLSLNRFDGPIPSILRHMTSLKFIDLFGNRFNSSIPVWLNNLDVVLLGKNLFTSIEGGLSSIITKNCHLKILDLSYNYFLRGDVFGSHENVSSGCKDYGLEMLFLNDILNFGTYRIPNWLGQLKNLKLLHLQNNSLHGPIPSSFGNLFSLEELDMSNNKLNGGIPISFGKLSNLRSLNLTDNNLDETIPESFGQLQSLQRLDFSNNSLKGVLSEIHFVNLARLEVVSFNENGFLSFEMKHNWVPPFQLKYLSMRSTMGFGTTEFPRWIGTQKKMEYLDLSSTSISGPIPTWFRFQNLSYLDLSHNQIIGSLPKNIDDQMPNLIGLLISDARINGSLPQSLCRLRNLEILVVSHNELSKSIPSCLSALNLFILDLSWNKFSGVFPSSFQNLSKLEVLNLAKNQLEGEPLTAMKSFKSLSVLDLERNKFCGNIPEWVGNRLENLQILNLQSNMFNGTIPSSLWLLSHLQILILVDNKLMGNIPPNVGNFCANPGPIRYYYFVFHCGKDSFADPYVSYVRQFVKSMNLNYSYSQLYSMVSIDLSNNNLYGHIPSEIATVKGLFNLNLSRNNLSGTIPVEFGTLVSLESLDLSFNQLSGPIPNSMSNLNYLGKLMLSNNNLSGPIPRQGHLSSFNDASSYEGNPNLCGDPLPVKCPNENPGEINNFDDHNGQDEGYKFDKMWFWTTVMAGYGLGLWGVVGTLIFKRSWRLAYFQFMDETKDKIHAAIR